MKINTHLRTQVAGYYRMRTFTEDGLLTQDTGEFRNLITNGGMDYYGSNVSATATYQNVAVGSGNTIPAFSDTQLVSLVASTASAGGPAPTYVPAAGTQPAYWTQTISYTFSVGAAAGNLSEIGVGPTTTNLFSRALILDNTGSPTTITVLSTEILQVTYEFRLYIDTTDVSGSYAISAVSYATTQRPYDIGSPSGSMAAGLVFNGSFPRVDCVGTQTLNSITVPFITPPALGTGSPSAYTNGTFFRDFTSNSTVSDGNIAGGIGIVIISSNAGKWQISHTPKIPKDNTKTMSLVFRISWARFTPPP